MPATWPTRPASAGRTSRAVTSSSPATPAEDRAASTATGLTSLWQPGYVGPLLPLLGVLGTVLALLRLDWRPAVTLGLASFALLFISAALVGNVSRYRYPADPLMAVLAVGALAWMVGTLAGDARRWPRQLGRRSTGRAPA